jgi:hypothetical protein
VRARAIDRIGELAGEIEPQPGRRTDLGPTIGAHSRLEAAKQAGLSSNQLATALQVHNVPRDQFEAQIESDEPPRAERG